MWHTAAGDRTLTGAEAILLRESLGHVVDMIERDADIDESWPFDIPVFDSLAWQQKLALLANVAAALFRKDVPMPELTAVSEAAVAVLFENIAQCIQIEIDFAHDLEMCDDGLDPAFWRKLVLAAIEDTDSKELGFIPTAAQPHPLADPECQMPAPACEVLDEWEWMLEALENYVLWDADYAMDELFMDTAVGQGRVDRAQAVEVALEGAAEVDLAREVAAVADPDGVRARAELLRRARCTGGCARPPARARPRSVWVRLPNL